MNKLSTWMAALLVCGTVAGGTEFPTIPADFAPNPATISERPLALRALNEHRSRRGKLLAMKPISVTFDKRLPSPGGDPRDFTSCGPYWWPDPNKPDGLPYIRRDGEFNPDFKFYDQTKIENLTKWVTTGALLWKFDRDKAAADKAVELLRVFFVDENTRMNPHMKYAQAIPGRTKGRTEGIIDTLNLADLVNMMVLLDDAPAMTPEIRTGLRQWFRDYTKWLATDPMALKDYEKAQNHGLSYHVQQLAFARFFGDADLARKHLDILRKLIVRAVDERGFLPAEVIRTRSWHYSAYALRMIMRAVTAARAMGVDLLAADSACGQVIRRAVENMMPYMLNPDLKWPYPLLKKKYELESFGSVVIIYQALTGSERARSLLPQLEAKTSTVDRICFAPAESGK